MRNIWIVAVIAAYSLWVITSNRVYEILNLWKWENKELSNKIHSDDPNRQIVLIKTTEYKNSKLNEQFFDTLSFQRLRALQLKQWSQIWLEEARFFRSGKYKIIITSIDTLTVWELESLDMTLDGNLKDVKRQDIY
jgi:hypothetical protein